MVVQQSASSEQLVAYAEMGPVAGVLRIMGYEPKGGAPTRALRDEALKAVRAACRTLGLDGDAVEVGVGQRFWVPVDVVSWARARRSRIDAEVVAQEKAVARNARITRVRRLIRYVRTTEARALVAASLKINGWPAVNVEAMVKLGRVRAKVRSARGRRLFVEVWLAQLGYKVYPSMYEVVVLIEPGPWQRRP